MEDLDPPREVAGSATGIINDLHRLRLVPDEPVLFQSNRLDAYQQAVDQLLATGLAYYCGCIRKDLPVSGIYPGTCREGIKDGKQARSIRFKLAAEHCEFFDKLRGRVVLDATEVGGDFIIRRADGLFAYQLAVVIDDDFQGVTQVVRGADLLDSTIRQTGLQSALGLVTPEYLHLPIALSADGQKLSKRSFADPVTHHEANVAIERVLRFLGHNPPPALSLEALWDWALTHWNSKLIPAPGESCI